MSCRCSGCTDPLGRDHCTLTSPARLSEMVVEWKAQRLVLVKYRNRISDDIRVLDEMIGAFGESENGASRP